MFEWRGASFSEISGHFGGEGTRIFSGKSEFFRDLGKGALENFLALRIILQ